MVAAALWVGLMTVGWSPGSSACPAAPAVPAAPPDLSLVMLTCAPVGSLFPTSVAPLPTLKEGAAAAAADADAPTKAGELSARDPLAPVKVLRARPSDVAAACSMMRWSAQRRAGKAGEWYGKEVLHGWHDT